MTFQFPERQKVLVRSRPKRDAKGRFAHVNQQKAPETRHKNPYGLWEHAASLTGKNYQESVHNVARALAHQKYEHSMVVDKASGLVLNDAWRTQNTAHRVHTYKHVPGLLHIHNHPSGAMFPSSADLRTGDGAVVSHEKGKTYITEWEWPKGTTHQQRRKIVGDREIYRAPEHLNQISRLSHVSRLVEGMGVKIKTTVLDDPPFKNPYRNWL